MIHLRRKEDRRDRVPLTVLFFDKYNAEDPLFVADVARRLAAASRQGLKAIVVHASDDAVERAREAAGRAGIELDRRADAVELAVRMTNQSITRRMIDEGVSAVSIQGNHRGLFQVTEDGSLECGRTEWLERAVSMGGIPVISFLAETEDGRSVETDPSASLEMLTHILSKMWSVTVVYFTTNRKSGLFDADGTRLDSVARDGLSAFEGIPDVAPSAPIGAADAVYLVNSAGIGAEGGISGTRIM